MIDKVKIKCDNCGMEFISFDVSNISEVEEELEEDGWTVLSDKHFCWKEKCQNEMKKVAN